MMGLSHADANLSNVDVVSRSARKHYGIKLHVDFDKEAEHDHDLKYWDKKHSRFRVPAMRWFIKKGQAIEEGKPIKIHFGHHFLVAGGNP